MTLVPASAALVYTDNTFVYHAAVITGRITGPAGPSVRPSVCLSRMGSQLENEKASKNNNTV